MPVKVVWDGLVEFEQALAAIPTVVTDRSQAIVTAAADATKTETIAGYPNTTGHMRAGVHTVEDTSKDATFAIEVRSTAPEAHLWEYGTQNRHTQRGWNRGSEPAHADRSLLAISEAHGPAMQAQLSGLVASLGFEVTGGYDPN
jgi:hypothetical protein